MSQLTFAQIEALWEQAGGSPTWAPTMAGIAEAESGGNTAALNNNPSTGDYSVGLWQINYFQSLLAPRTAAYGSPSYLQGNPLAQAKAAVSILGGGGGLSAWQGDTVGQVALDRGGQPLSLGEVQSALGTSGLQGLSGTVSPVAGATGPNAALTSATGSLTSSTPAPTSTIGKILSELDGALNPKNPGILSSLTTLGLSDVEATVIMIVSRALGFVLGTGIFLMGFYMIARQSGALGVVGIAQRQQRESRLSEQQDILAYNAQTSRLREARAQASTFGTPVSTGPVAGVSVPPVFE